MRKSLLYIFGGSIALLLLVVSYQYSRSLQNDAAKSSYAVSDIAEDNLVADVREGGADAPSESAPPPFPAYKGQAVAEIGSDPILDLFPADVLAQRKALLAELAGFIAHDPYNFDHWLAVGAQKKFANNYAGARDAWEYAKVVNPHNGIAHLNLAHLYAYYLRDPGRAEQNYSLAIAADSGDVLSSRAAFAAFYRDFGQPDRAREWFEQALEFHPGDPAILTEIDRLSQ